MLWWTSVASAAMPLIVGGGPIPLSDAPGVVSVQRNSNHVCTGVLLAPDVVLTAGHCGTPETVVWGNADRSLGTVATVDQVITHPDFDTTFDATLLRLSEPVGAELPDLAIDCLAEGWIADGGVVRAAGWGATTSGASAFSVALHGVDTWIVDADCSEPDQGCFATVQPAGELVAGGLGEDSCAGDSGGPLYVQTPYGWALAASTSRGIAGAVTPCGEGGIYVRLDALRPWIEDTLGEPLEGPDCDSLNRRPSPDASIWEVTQGAVATRPLDAGDADLGDAHTWTVVTPPAHGTLVIEGALTYRSDAVFVGVDGFTIAVADDGDPALSTTVTVPVHVYPPSLLPDTGAQVGPGGGGCSTVPWMGGWLILPWCLLRRRRP